MKKALKFIILFGIVSLFADMTYEGGRSITGPYLAILGANAIIIGFIAGFGEFIGYGIRILFGALADRTGKYWNFALVGYILNLIAVPLLALSNQWEIAIILIFAERFGKAIRSPSKDVMLSHATAGIGRGIGFGIHEAMDQIGAVTGPLIIAGIFFIKNNNYSVGFSVLLIPALISLSVLFLTRKLYPNTNQFESNSNEIKISFSDNRSNTIANKYVANTRRTPRKDIISNACSSMYEIIKFSSSYRFYLLFTIVSITGYANFQLISFHFKHMQIVSDVQIPIFFSIAMASAGLSALISGRTFDKKGILILIIIPIITIPITPLAFSSSYNAALTSVILWGSVMGIQETVMRAAIPSMIPMTKRGIGYGIFNVAFGGSWFLGSVLMGILYSISINYIVFFSIIIELVSLPLLFKVMKDVKK